jgi:hypothetical protein
VRVRDTVYTATGFESDAARAVFDALPAAVQALESEIVRAAIVGNLNALSWVVGAGATCIRVDERQLGAALRRKALAIATRRNSRPPPVFAFELR